VKALDWRDHYGYKGRMKTVTVTEAKNHLSSLIDRVRAGESITILDRGTPVARLEPVVSDAEQDGRLRRLARAGIVRPPDRTDLLEIFAQLPPAPAATESVVDALLEERRTGR
jgi:prevent-host-death family protein